MANLLVFGTSIEFSHVKALADAGHKVYYYTDHISSFPEFEDYASGLGFDNIEKIHNPYSYIDKVDQVLTFDVYFGDVFEFIKSKGYKTFGGGNACELELNRIHLKKALDLVKIPSPPYKIVKGFNKVKPPCVLKLNIWRGSLETTILVNETQKRNLEILLRAKFGDFIDDMEFVIEDIVDGKYYEMGIDAFYDNGFVFPLLYGVEWKKGVYIAKVVNSIFELPEATQDMLTKLDVILKRLNYRGMVSTEQFYNGKDYYFLDITIRSPYPLGLAYSYWIENFADVIVNYAKPKFKGKYVVSVPFHVNSHDQFIYIKFPEKDNRYKFEALTKKNNNYYIPKQPIPTSGVVCEVFDSLDENKIQQAIQNLINNIEAYNLEDNLTDLPDAIKHFKEGIQL